MARLHGDLEVYTVHSGTFASLLLPSQDLFFFPQRCFQQEHERCMRKGKVTAKKNKNKNKDLFVAARARENGNFI